jgi:predicted RNA methylase
MNQKIPQKIQTIKRKMEKKNSENQYQKNLNSRKIKRKMKKMEKKKKNPKNQYQKNLKRSRRLREK